MIFSYIRTSVWKKNKVTMEMQQNAIQKKLEELGLPYPPPENVYEDRGVSGAKLEGREGLQLLLKRLSDESARQSTLIVYRFNRLSRDSSIMITILEILEENEITLISVMEPLPTENSVSFQKMLINIYGTIGQFEREMTIENVRLGLEQKRREKKPLSSSAPFGYSYSSDKLESIEGELNSVRFIYDLYLTNLLGYKKICQRLKQTGHKFRGRDFIESDIYRILSNKTYYGILKGGTVGGEYWGNHQTLITEEEFNTVQKIRKTRHTQKKSKRKNWLRGKVSCPVCRQNFTPKRMSYNNKFYNYYYCASPSCNQKGINANQAEDRVIKSIIQFITKNSILELMLNEINEQQKEASQKEKLIQRQLNYTRKKLFSQFEKNELTNEEFTEALSEINDSLSLPNKEQKRLVTKESLEKILSQQSKVQDGSVPIEFYFNLVERVTLDKDYRIKEIYLKTLGINILEQEEIKL